MQDPGIFTFGLFAFVLQMSGIIFTLREFSKKEDRDQSDTRFQSIPQRNKTASAKKRI